MQRSLTHQQLERLVAGLATGGLDDADGEQARRHLAECETCQASYAAYREIWLSLGASAPRVLPPVAVRERVLKAVAPREKPVVHEQPLISRLLDAFRPAPPVLVAQRARILVAVVLALLLPVAALLGVGIFAPSPALATSTTLTIISGSVEVAGPDGVFASAEDGMLLGAGQRIRTAADGIAVVTFFDGSTLTVLGDSDVRLAEVVANAGDGASAISLFQSVGRTWSSVQKLVNPRSRYELRTPSATAAVRGTTFGATVTEEGRSEIDTDEGAVEVGGSTGATVLVRKDETTVVEAPGRPAEQPRQQPQRDRVEIGANVNILIVVNGLACGRTAEGQRVEQLHGCSVTADGVRAKGVKPGEIQVVARTTVDVDVTVRAVGFAGDRESFRVETTGRAQSGSVNITRLQTETRPDGSLDARPFQPFEQTDRSPARIGRPQPGERGPVGPAGQPPLPGTQPQPGTQPRPGTPPGPGEEPRPGEQPQPGQPQPGTRPPADTQREGEQRPGAGELPRDTERAIDPEGARGRPIPGAGGLRGEPRTPPERPGQDQPQQPPQRPSQPQTQPGRSPGGGNGLPAPSIELPRPPALGPRQETQPGGPRGPEGQPPSGPRQEPPRQEQPKPESPGSQPQRPGIVPQPPQFQAPVPGSGPGSP